LNRPLRTAPRWALLALFVLAPAVAGPGARAAEDAPGSLSLWPPHARSELLALLSSCQARSAGTYAVFDADNTLWQGDLEQALLPFLENRGRIRLEAMEAARKPVPALRGESAHGYYVRLCGIDGKLGMAWIAQAFSGFTLAELREAVGEMMASGGPVPAVEGADGRSREVEVPVPRIYPAQAELVRALQERGVQVYVVTAALEELVRMVASDPRYGLGVPPENVIGVNLLLEGAGPGPTAGAMERRAGKKGLAAYFDPGRMQLLVTPALYTPASWYAGKLAAIKESIHPDRRPVLVAGDAPNDHYMLFYADVEDGGRRVFVRHSEAYWNATREAIRRRAGGTGYRTADPLPERGWVVVAPKEIGGR